MGLSLKNSALVLLTNLIDHSDDKPKKVSVDQLRNEIRNILSGIPVVGEEDIDNMDDLNLDEIDVESDAEQVSIGDDDREEFEVNDTPKKGKKHGEQQEEEEIEDGTFKCYPIFQKKKRGD